MAKKGYGVRVATLTFDAGADGNSQALDAASLGYGWGRRTHAIFLISTSVGNDAAHRIHIQVSPDNTNWVTIATFSGTDALPSADMSTAVSTDLVAPFARLLYDKNGAGSEPGDIEVKVVSKHIPSTLNFL